MGSKQCHNMTRKSEQQLTLWHKLPIMFRQGFKAESWDNEKASNMVQELGINMPRKSK